MTQYLELPDVQALRQADPLLIGIAGRAGSGKTAAANYLEQQYDLQAAAFAEPLKDLLEQMFLDRGVDHAHLHEPGLKTTPIPQFYGLTARQLMQRIGDWGRSIDAEYWVDQLAHRLGMAAPAVADRFPIHDRIVISDVRYFNEAAWVAARGGVLIRLTRDSAGPAGTHSSESQIDRLLVHWDVRNNGPTLDHLHAEMDWLMSCLQVSRCERVGPF
ncbi:MAG: hypothetical protein RL375_2978 [Pseudomonadota bacterium]